MGNKPRKFEALVSEQGLDDIGMSGRTIRVDQLVKGRMYAQADQRNYDAAGGASPPFFVDDIGCSRNISDMLKSKKIKEIV